MNMTFGPRMKKRNPSEENGELMSRSPGGSNTMCRLLRPIALLIACNLCVEAQQVRAREVLARALHLADLYNWADAAPAFTEAEQLFVTAGDQRNALYARLGRIRSNIERDQQTLPKVSAQLAEALASISTELLARATAQGGISIWCQSWIRSNS